MNLFLFLFNIYYKGKAKDQSRGVFAMQLGKTSKPECMPAAEVCP